MAHDSLLIPGARVGLATIGNIVIGISELDDIAEARLEDGKKLLNAGRFDGQTTFADTRLSSD